MSDNTKNVLIYATCQGRMIYDVLLESGQFGQGFKIINQVQNYELIRTGRSFLTYLDYFDSLKETDVFIHQPLSDIYGDNATDLLKSFLKPSAISISIPYVYNSSFWPIVETGNVDVSDDFLIPLMPIIKNRETIEELAETLTEDQIISDFLAGNIDFRYVERFNNDLSILQEKEKITDVKVSDFILDNYKRMPLFDGPSHPTYDVICHMGNQILNILGIDEKVQYNGQGWYRPPLEPQPFTKCAKSALGLEFDTGSDDFYIALIQKILNR